MAFKYENQQNLMERGRRMQMFRKSGEKFSQYFKQPLYEYQKLLYGNKRMTLFRHMTGSLLIGYQVIYSNLIIFGIQTVNTENKFCLESTISTYPGLFQYFLCKFNCTSVFSQFHSLNGIVGHSSLVYQLLFHARCLRTCHAHK